MKKILVPCDFSPPAIEAFMFAQDLALASNAQVVVLRVIDIPATYESAFGLPPQIFDVTMMKEIERRAREKFNTMLETYRRAVSGTSFITELGAVTPSIRKIIRSQSIDLVVMGTHGASGAKEFFIGSNAEKVVRTAAVPVLVVRKAMAVSSVSDIVFPTDFTSPDPELIAKVKELQSFFNARLHVLHVVTPNKFQSDFEVKVALEDFVNEYELNNVTINYHNDLNEADGIMSFVKEINADMIVMATHGRRGLAHLLSGSVAEDVVNHVDCAIWTYCT